MRTQHRRERRTRERKESALSRVCEGGWRLVVVVARLHSLFLSFSLSSKSSSSSSLFWKKFPLFLFGERERERERDRCVCKTGWMRFSRLSRPTKRRERSSRGSFFHSPFFGLDEKKRNNNKKKVNSTKCDLTILSLSLFLSLFNNNNNNNNNNTIKTQQQSRRRG